MTVQTIEKLQHRLSVVGLILLAATVLLMPNTGFAATFPNVSDVSDADEILESYPVYLNFIIGIGRQVDAKSTKRLANSFAKLKKHYPDGAAQFLKGLRFELIHRADMMGQSRSSLTSTTPEVRNWVRKFLPIWANEADEQFFRSYSFLIAKRNQRDKE